MKVLVLGSMQFSEQMAAVRDQLNQLGHQTVTSIFIDTFIGKNDQEKELLKIKQKSDEDAMRRDCQQVLDNDAVLVLNLKKHHINNYIGGNVLIEIGYAHILGKQIFLYNPIPEIRFYKTEIEAMKPVILNGNLSLLK